METKTARKTFLIVVLLALTTPLVMYAETSEPVRGITPERFRSIIAGVLGLISIIVGLRARRAATRNSKGAVISLCAGLLGVIISAWHLASTSGAFGTGKGRAGAIIALVLGLIGTFFGWQARSMQVNTKPGA